MMRSDSKNLTKNEYEKHTRDSYPEFSIDDRGLALMPSVSVVGVSLYAMSRDLMLSASFMITVFSLHCAGTMKVSDSRDEGR
jgi:hypothetical protein